VASIVAANMAAHTDSFMGPHVVRLAARQAVRVMAVIVEVIAAADVDSFTVHRSVAESDSITVAITKSFIVHRSVVKPVSVAVLVTESDAQWDTTYPMA